MQKIALSLARRGRGGGKRAFRALARRHGGRVQESARPLSSFALPRMREQRKWPQRRSFSMGTSAANMRPNFVLWKDTGALKVASMQGSLNAQGFMDRPVSLGLRNGVFQRNRVKWRKAVKYRADTPTTNVMFPFLPLSLLACLPAYSSAGRDCLQLLPEKPFSRRRRLRP